jgi:endogenous inhibitor of DNA gyrase (YacG/DUF329 family)
MAQCPICNKAVAPRAKNSAFPFCSDRCKTVDLGKWLNEEYRVPLQDEDDKVADTDAGDAPPKRDVRN